MADEPRLQPSGMGPESLSEAVAAVPAAQLLEAGRRRQRLLLGVLMLFGIAGAAYAARNQYNEYCDRETLAALRAAGLNLTDRGTAIAITDPTRKCASDECLRHIGDLNCRVIVNFDNCPQITDAGLAHLKGQSNLRILSLRSTGITDAGVQSLAGLTELESLDIAETAVSDAGVAALNDLRLKKLIDLHLDSTRVTDAAMDELGQVTTLRYVILAQTDVTQDGARTLRSANPEVMVFGIP